MKQPFVNAGGRRWHGDEMRDFWNDLNDAVEALAEPAEGCVLTGCGISGSGPYAIDPGIVGIAHLTDGYKICRFAGGSTASFPCYLVVTKTTTNKTYDDLLGHPALDEYTATLQTTLPSVPYLTITATGGQRLVDGLMAGRFVHVGSGSGTIYTGAFSYEFVVNKATRKLLLRGSILVTTSVPDPPLAVSFFSIPAGYFPTANHYFQATIMHHGSYPVYDTQGMAFASASCRVDTSGNVAIMLRRPASGSYTLFFNTEIPLY